jgi:hypothetical protein
VNSLVQIGEVGVPQCLSYLKDDHYKIRAVVIETIGEIGGTNVEDPILNALDDDHHHVRKLAARSAGKIQLSKAESKLIPLIQDPNIQVQIWAAYALYRLGRVETRDFLIEKLNSSDLISLSDATCALSETGDEQSIKELVSFWKMSLEMEEQENQRRVGSGQSLVEYQFSNLGNFTPRDLEASVRYSLANIGPDIAYYIVPLLSNKNPYVRKNAVSLINEISWKPDSEKDRISYMVAAKDWEGCKNLNSANLLTPYLTDEYRDTWEGIFGCMGRIGDHSIFNEIVPILTYWHYRRNIIGLLYKLNWQPGNNKEQVHFWVASGNGTALRNSWQITKAVLLEDIESKNYHTIENALYAFVGIGKVEIINELIDTLNNKGNKIMAETYLNCGHTKLKFAAEEWGRRNGYQIVAGEGASPVAWGGL